MICSIFKNFRLVKFTIVDRVWKNITVFGMLMTERAALMFTILPMKSLFPNEILEWNLLVVKEKAT